MIETGIGWVGDDGDCIVKAHLLMRWAGDEPHRAVRCGGINLRAKTHPKSMTHVAEAVRFELKGNLKDPL